MVSSTLFISALLALAPLADASLHQRSARHSRHNGRGIARRQATNGTASDSAKCVKRSHPPAAASTSISLSDDSVPTAFTSAKPVPTKSPKTEKAVPSPDENEDGEEPATTKATKSASATASSTKVSAAPSSSASSSSSSSSGAISGLVGALFPAGSSNGWTMASNIASSGVDGVSLTTSNLDVVSSIKSISNPIGTFQGKTAQAANFPKGNWGLNKGISGGMSMYFAGKTSREEWNGAKEMTFGYSIYFDEGFGWNKGGKLPGLYFGKTEEDARGCSGGNRDTECASVRLMWRADGKGEVYTYLPSPEVSSQFNANKALCDVAPQSECNDVYGASVGRGAWNFEAGAWNDVSIRVLLNDAGKANGEIEMFFNGKSVVNVDGLIIAYSKDGTPVVAQGVMAQSFFGGSDGSWASPHDQAIHFADYSVAITKTRN